MTIKAVHYGLDLDIVRNEDWLKAASEAVGNA